jgi:hypothetical protein
MTSPVEPCTDDTFRPSNVKISTPRLVDDIGDWLGAIEQGLLPDSPEAKKAVKLVSLIMTLWPDCPHVNSAIDRHHALMDLRDEVAAETTLKEQAANESKGKPVVALFKPRA